MHQINNMKLITFLTLFLICDCIQSQAQTDTLYANTYMNTRDWKTMDIDTTYFLMETSGYDSTYWGQVEKHIIDPHEIMVNPPSLYNYKYEKRSTGQWLQTNSHLNSQLDDILSDGFNYPFIEDVGLIFSYSGK